MMCSTEDGRDLYVELYIADRSVPKEKFDSITDTLSVLLHQQYKHNSYGELPNVTLGKYDIAFASIPGSNGELLRQITISRRHEKANLRSTKALCEPLPNALTAVPAEQIISAQLAADVGAPKVAASGRTTPFCLSEPEDNLDPSEDDETSSDSCSPAPLQKSVTFANIVRVRLIPPSNGPDDRDDAGNVDAEEGRSQLENLTEKPYQRHYSTNKFDESFGDDEDGTHCTGNKDIYVNSEAHDADKRVHRKCPGGSNEHLGTGNCRHQLGNYSDRSEDSDKEFPEGDAQFSRKQTKAQGRKRFTARRKDETPSSSMSPRIAGKKRRRSPAFDSAGGDDEHVSKKSKYGEDRDENMEIGFADCDDEEDFDFTPGKTHKRYSRRGRNAKIQRRESSGNSQLQ